MTNTSENDEHLLAIWEQLCVSFGKIRLINARPEDLAASMETWKNDHVSLSRQTIAWKEAEALTNDLPLEALESLLELARVNSTHVNHHLGFTATAVIGFPLGIYGIFSDYINGFLGSQALVSVALAAIFVGLALFLTRLWLNKWQAMELTTCLEHILAIRRARAPDSMPSSG